MARIAMILAMALSLLAGLASGAAVAEEAGSFRIPFKTFFYDAKLDTGGAELPSAVVQTFTDSAGAGHRLTWRPGFDIQVSSKQKRFGLPPYKARAWSVTSMTVTLDVDLDGKPLTSYRFQVRRTDRFEVAVKDTSWVTRVLPGGDYRGALVEILRPRLEFRANEVALRPAFTADIRLAGKGVE